MNNRIEAGSKAGTQEGSRRAARVLLAVVILLVGAGANLIRLAGGAWPEWMDGRYGGPLPWGMFAVGIECSTEVVATVQTPAGSVEVGRGLVRPGPGEWFWTVDDSWHVAAWARPENLDLEAAARLAREAAGTSDGAVSFVLRERTSTETGVVTRDLPLGEWGGACT